VYIRNDMFFSSSCQPSFFLCFNPLEFHIFLFPWEKKERNIEQCMVSARKVM